jgi:integrase
MAKREHLSMRKPAPAWLNDIVPNAAHRHWGHQLAVALDLEVDGQGASTGFELTAFAMGRHGAAIGIKELIDAALVPAAMAAAARASITYPLLGKPGDLPPDSTTLVLERLDSRLRRCDATFPGATAVFSILLRNAIRGKHHIGRATVQRMASMAGACLADGKPADRERWRALARLQPLDLRSLEEFIKLHGEGEPVTLARTLHKALANKKPSPLPLETANQPGSGKDNTPPLPFAPGTAPGQPTKKTVVLTGPSWAALHSAASYAGMAETFNLELDHARIDVSEQALIGAACRKVLRGADDAALIDSALLQSVAEVLNCDHDNSLELALTPELGEDTWYCADLHCILQDRRARRGLSTDPSRREWEAVYVYPEAVDRIELLLKRKPDAKRFWHLMPHRKQEELVQATAAWVKSLTDTAHPATPGRAVHSACLAYRKAGATDTEIAAIARAPAAASSSSGNYYAPNPQRHHQLACAAFELLGRERPPLVGPSPLLAPLDVPDDEDLRIEWQQLRDWVRTRFEALDTAGIAEVATLVTEAMAACRKAYELLSAARDQVRQHPRVVDVKSSDDWHFDSDKDTVINSDRLQAITSELVELIRVALLLRQKARDRLRTLGVTGDAMPAALAKMTPDTPLFCQLRALPTKSGLRLVVGVLKEAHMKALSQRWHGPLNMGRRYWVGQAAEHGKWLDEQALTGHGRGLKHLGSHCLSMSVKRLLDSAKHLVTATLQRLALPAFGEGIVGTPEPIIVPVDLRSVDRRRNRETRPTDTPQHYAEWRTPGFIAAVKSLRPYVGKNSGLSGAARALLGLIVVQGIHHSADVREAWRSLREQWRKKGSVWIDWIRHSGQPIEMQLLAPVRLAADEVKDANDWPSLAEVETELCAWLVARNAEHPLRPVNWPNKPNATITALCWLMAHWVRVHAPAFLSLAYDPDLMTATLDRRSLDLLQHREAPGKALKLRSFGSRLSKARPEAIGKESLLWIQTEVGLVAKSERRLGERQKRAKKVQQALADTVSAADHDTPPESANETAEQQAQRWAYQAEEIERGLLKTAPRSLMSAKAQMVLVYLDLEAILTRARHKDANAPGTWYDYVSAARTQLEDKWPVSADPTQIQGRRWCKISRKILARLPADTDITHQARCKAWRRMLTVLSSHPAYAAAAAALDQSGTPAGPAKYIASAASALWPRRLVPAIQAGVDELFGNEPLAGPQAHVLLSLLLDAGPRRSQACGIQLADLAKDGRWFERFPSGHNRKKTDLSIGRSLLKPATAADMLALRALMQSLRPTPDYFFVPDALDDSLTYAQTLLDAIQDIARNKIGSEWVVIHSARGSAAMELFAPGWEGHIEALAQAPFQLADALAIVTALEGDGPDHMAKVLCSLGHASHKTFTRRYGTCWPLWYAASMRALLSDIELDPQLIRKMPHLADDTQRSHALGRRRWARCNSPEGIPSDDWDWPLSHHFSKRTPGRKPKPAQAAPKRSLNAPGGNGAQPALRPAELSSFNSLLNYLVHRHLGLGRVAAAKGAEIGLDVAAWLDVCEGAPPAKPAGEVIDQPGAESSKDRIAEEKEPKNSLTFAMNQLNSSDGQALIAALATASPWWWWPLAALLEDSAKAPPVTKALVVRLRDLLPSSLAVDVTLSAEYFDAALAESIKDLDRVHINDSSKVQRWRPRVRVAPEELNAAGDVDGQAAAMLTRLATLTLAICPYLTEYLR